MTSFLDESCPMHISYITNNFPQMYLMLDPFLGSICHITVTYLVLFKKKKSTDDKNMHNVPACKVPLHVGIYLNVKLLINFGLMRLNFGLALILKEPMYTQNVLCTA